ncbi:MAG: hypothetical protein ACUZ8E_05470 [Candidatus Anammoxibacter sp.]
MREERFDEPISKILVLFEKGMIKPISFHWSKRDYTIKENNMHWVDKKTRPIRYGFSVTVGSGEVFQLSYREGDPVWHVETVIIK